MARSSARNHAADDRRRLGQVFTPRPVADWMVRWACAASPDSILEPAVGEGVFIEALESRYARSRKRPFIVAYDVDDRMIDHGRARQSPFQIEHRHESFIESISSDRFEAAVANPPYVRHHEHKLSEACFERFDRMCGHRLSRLTNLYGLFLLRIWESLAPGGRAAVITPAEWLNADFGKAIKACLTGENAIDGIVHFGHASRVFSDAMTTAAITLLRRDRGPEDGVRLVTVESAEELNDQLLDKAVQFEVAALDPARKWTPLFQEARLAATTGSKTRRSAPSSTLTLGQIARCVRGIATGANDYFTLRESDRVRFEIDPMDLSPCVTKAQHATDDVFNRRCLDALRDADHRIHLLNPRARLTPEVERYLDHGRSLGIDKRYLPSHRPVWYRPEERPPAPIWVSVFARGRFRFIRNEAGALSLTAFHAIYPKSSDESAVGALIAYLQSDAAQQSLSDHQRIYAEGLLKLEPKDVEAIPVPESVARLFGD